MNHPLTAGISRIAHLTSSTGFLYESLRFVMGRNEGAVVKKMRQLQLPSSLLETTLPTQSKKQILMFSYLPYWLEVCLPIVAVLGQFGHAVELVYLPYEDYHRDNPWYKKLYDRLAYGQLADLSIPGVSLNLIDIAAGCLADGEENQAIEQAKLDAAYILHTDKCNLSLPVDRDVMDFRLKKNRDAIAGLGALMDQRHYDLLIVPNGAILEFGAAYRAAKLRGIPTVTFEFMGSPGRIMVSNGAPVVDLKIEAAWNAYRQSGLSSAALSEAMQMIESRSQVKPGQSAGYYQVVGRQDAVGLRSTLGLAADKKTALLCSNVVWDSAALGRDVCFSGSKDWIEQTVRWFAGSSDWQLVVRIHPAESLIGTAQSVAEIVRQALPKGAPNVVVVEPTDPINTYSLANLADVGIVHTSTVGIEFAVLGLPVVCAGRAHYRGKGFTIDPETSHAYFDMLSNADLAAMKSQTAESRNLAAVYLDFYINYWPLPFPWHIASMQQDIGEWPVERVLSAEGLNKYGQVWSLLVNENTSLLV